LAEPWTYNFPSHRTRTSWGCSFDFSGYGSGYLTGASARLVVVDAAGNVVLDLLTEEGLTIGDKVVNEGEEDEETLVDVILEVDQLVVELAAGEYGQELWITLASGQVVPVSEGTWPISATRMPEEEP
jgi:hypothetical protein